MRDVQVNLGNEIVDVTVKDNAPWRKLLAQAGIQSLSITANGIFYDSAVEESVRGDGFENSINNFQVIFGNGDTLEGAFQLSSYNRSGSYNDAEGYSIQLESDGQPTFTSA